MTSGLAPGRVGPVDGPRGPWVERQRVGNRFREWFQGSARPNSGRTAGRALARRPIRAILRRAPRLRPGVHRRRAATGRGPPRPTTRPAPVRGSARLRAPAFGLLGPGRPSGTCSRRSTDRRILPRPPLPSESAGSPGPATPWFRAPRRRANPRPIPPPSDAPFRPAPSPPCRPRRRPRGRAAGHRRSTAPGQLTRSHDRSASLRLEWERRQPSRVRRTDGRRAPRARGPVRIR